MHRLVCIVELQLKPGQRGVAEIRIEYVRVVMPQLLVPVRDDIVREDVVVFEMLKVVVNGAPPQGVVVHHGAQRVQEQRSFEVLVFITRLTINATLGHDGVLVLDL